MPRIEHDPNLEPCPDFASAPYNLLRAVVVNAGSTEEEAVNQLVDAWRQENQIRQETWQQQVEEDRLAEEEANNLIREQEAEERDTARREREKKRPKMNDFDTNKSVGSFIAPRPSTYALNKLENFEYVELFYFTREGCLDAQNHQRTEADDALGLSKVGDLVSFRSISAVRASKNVILDANLSWNQMSYAKNILLQHLEKADWPVKHISALAHFFIGLESSPYRTRACGEKILLTYQARVRRHWHDTLKQERGDAFNIVLIDDSLMESISNEIWNAEHAKNKREVSAYSLIPAFPD